MAYRFFLIPARDEGKAAEELNRFLRSHRVLSVDRRWVDQGESSYWAFCVDYLETGQPVEHPAKGPGEARGKVDYREVLSPEHFAAFAKLRSLRAEMSKTEGVPVYGEFPFALNPRNAVRGLTSSRDWSTMVRQVGARRTRAGVSVCEWARSH